ncbi:MAG: YigZ family protein [Lachnospiraceae bacterium]|nr:YigZ family protein [Lachnospiraceae bacterium]
MPDQLKFIYRGGKDEIVEKKSRFIGQVFPVTTEEEAISLIEQTKKKYWGARHNCYAYILGEYGEITRCTDDGEPAGTAGRPILEVLQGEGIHDVLLIVTRYFGGTLLGTGGLVRAYSQAAKAGLAASQVLEKVRGHQLTIHTDYNGIGKLQYITAQSEIAVMDTQYAEDVTMILAVPIEECDKLVKQITEATAGQAQIEGLEEIVHYAVADGKVILR